MMDDDRRTRTFAMIFGSASKYKCCCLPPLQYSWLQRQNWSEIEITNELELFFSEASPVRVEQQNNNSWPLFSGFHVSLGRITKVVVFLGWECEICIMEPYNTWIMNYTNEIYVRRTYSSGERK